MKKRFAALILALVMALSFSVTAFAASNPPDIVGHEYYDDIKRLDNYDAIPSLIQGWDFKPDQRITQAEFWQILTALYPGRSFTKNPTNAAATMEWACQQLTTVGKVLGYDTTWGKVAYEELTRARACHLICIWLDSTKAFVEAIGKQPSTPIQSPTVIPIAPPNSNYPYWACPFTDLTEAWYYDPVMWMLLNGYTSGTSPTTFSPNQEITQAEMLTLLWRVNGSPKSDYACPVSGVSKDAFYYTALCWAGSKGMFSGTGDNNDPARTTCTRAMTVWYMWKAAGSPSVNYSSYSNFKDISSNASYRSAVGWANKNGITNGTSSTTFSPLEPVTRAQAATFLYRARGLK